MQLFIGLTFKASTHPYQKIDSFRRRFDSKFDKSDVLQMTLLPPFTFENVSPKELDDFAELCTEDLESNFIGHDSPLEVDFKGFGKTTMLTTLINSLIVYCSFVCQKKLGMKRFYLIYLSSGK